MGLPVQYNPQTVRYVHELLDCPPGVCGECCHYGLTPITTIDVERIISHTDYTKEDFKEIIIEKEGKAYIGGAREGGCPFLKDKACTIYSYRPDACWLFPIQGMSKEVIWSGEKTRQLVIRIRCWPALEVARKIILKALSEGDRMMLPNLMVINKYKEEGNGSN